MKRCLLAALVLLSLAASFAALLASGLLWMGLPWEWRHSLRLAVYRPWQAPARLGDGGPAADILLCYPMGLALDARGDLLVSDRGRDLRGRVVWRIDAEGTAHVVAGSGRIGDGTQRAALDLELKRPESLAVAPDGAIFLSDGYLHVVFRIAPGGRVERFAGTGVPGDAGDGGPASEAQLNRPADLRLDRRGHLYIADVRNHRVRRVDASGRIETVAGIGEPGFSPDGTLATEAYLDTPWGLGLDREDRLLIGDGANHRVRRIEGDGRLVTIAGNGRPGYAGDGGPATEASLNFPEALAVDARGQLFIGDEYNHALRRVDTEGTITTVMGTGFPGRAWIGGVARVSPLDDPENVLVTLDGLIVTDGNNGRVIRIGPDGVVRLVAGRGTTERCTPRW